MYSLTIYWKPGWGNSEHEDGTSVDTAAGMDTIAAYLRLTLDICWLENIVAMVSYTQVTWAFPYAQYNPS